MNHRFTLFGLAFLLIANAALATSFVVPTDDELVAKAQAIVIGTVEGSYVQEVNGSIETVYEVRVERSVKGAARANELLSVVSPGGVIDEERGLLVPSSAHFNHGDRVLLFLSRNGGRWATTDMTLGKFRFVVSTTGERLLVRDLEDVVGWDHAGRVHREKVRREKGFLHFVEERARGRQIHASYEVEASEVTIAPDRLGQITVNQAPFPAATYTDWVNNQPVRWPNMSAGVPFWKRSDTNIPGAADGGAQMIVNGLNAWNNECASLINLTYSGQRATASANHDGFNMVEYNDPQGRVSGSWSGSGTVAITFISFAGTHSFAGGTWLSITGADVVFQDGYPATNASFFSAMTHELGHGIGWRHSNQDYATGGACNSSTQECTSQAIMNSSVSANLQSLQPWDVHAAESVYPGGTCGGCTAPTVTGLNSATINAGQSATLTVSASGTAPFSYQWFIGASGNTSSPIAGATGSSVTVSPASSTQYWVRVSNECGTVNSPTTTVVVNQQCAAPAVTSLNSATINAGQSATLRVGVSGTAPFSYQWFIGASGNTSNPISGATGSSVTVSPASSTQYWVRISNGCGTVNSPTTTVVVNQPPPPSRRVEGDYSGDGRTDVTVYRPSTGFWYSNGGFNPVQMGITTDRPVPADYDGDGRTDIALWRSSNGLWIIRNSSTGGIVQVTWGQSGDVPVPADYNGDGRADLTVFRPSTGVWHSNGGFNPTQFGMAGDVPVPADYNGDGRADIAVWRPSNGVWYIVNVGIFGLGQNGDIPMPADYNGDGRADIAVFRPSTGVWFSNGAFNATQFGANGDIPVPGDYNGDGRYDIAVFRPSNGVWYILNGSIVSWGQNGDIPAIRRPIP